MQHLVLNVTHNWRLGKVSNYSFMKELSEPILRRPMSIVNIPDFGSC